MKYHGPTKQSAEITVINPETETIEAALPDGGAISIYVGEVPTLFRWPIVGEIWSVERDSQNPNLWQLRSRVQGRVIKDQDGAPSISLNEDAGIEERLPGEARIDSGAIYDGLGDKLVTQPVLTAAVAAKTSRIFPMSIDLYGPQSQEAFSLVGPSTGTYIFPGSALSSSTFEFYQFMNPIIRYAVWQVVWTPTNAGVGIRLVKMDAGPTNITQISEITGFTGGPRNDSQNVTAAIQTIVSDFASASFGAHKQIAHQLKGDGSTGAKVYVSRVSILMQV